MSKPLLKLATRGKPGPSYALIRKACRMFKGSYGPRAERHANIIAWLAAVDRLGEQWVLSKRNSVKRKEVA